ncbi:arsenate reductase (azurin) small subunit [Hydrogenivirga caldilitoris]|uniref:arsenate reductase (azurin) small subunit n=1 Tax=Hydrogenivirga caldilitoris TaxID=246264 RepID=UPI003CCD0011
MKLNVSRRTFVGGSIVLGTLLVSHRFAKACVAPSLPYRKKKIASIRDVKAHKPIMFNYPDENSPAVLVKIGRPAIGGVGPDKDIVAFSALCTHQGCPLQYSKGRFVCKCHYSMFDPAKNGQTYQGHASEWLPQIKLSVDRRGNIYAEAVEGLVWGRAINLLPK